MIYTDHKVYIFLLKFSFRKSIFTVLKFLLRQVINKYIKAIKSVLSQCVTLTNPIITLSFTY